MTVPSSDADHFTALSDGTLRLDRLRKDARSLLRALQAGAPEAIRRMNAVHSGADPEQVRLADALLVIAREAGFPSWPRLRRHADRQAFLRQRMTSGGRTPPDTEGTVHLRCGSDIRRGLEVAGFCGRFVEFSDPFCHGPVSAGADLPLLRQIYLQGAYGLDPADAEARVRRSYQELTAVLAEDGGPLVLWFEHDAYDQLILAYLLWRLQQDPPRRQVEVICVDTIPGVDRFHGLGQLSPDSLLMLWEACRVPLQRVVIEAGAQIWDLFAHGDVPGLNRCVGQEQPVSPVMMRAIQRHLQELPAVGSGLSLTQSLSLSALSRAGDAGMTGAALFRTLTRQEEPLPWLGDMMYWRELADLGLSDPAVMVWDDPAVPWPERRLVLTAAGRACLDGQLDFMTLTTARRWFGPVVIGPGYAGPRWDRQAGRVVSG